jgi:hypothetical protein
VPFLNRQVSSQCWQTGYWRGFGDPIYMSGIASVFDVIGQDIEIGIDDIGHGIETGIEDIGHDIETGIDDIDNAIEDIFKRRRREAAVPSILLQRSRRSDECPSGEEASGLFCYRSCKKGYKGDGPVCFSESCSGFYSYSCKLPVLCAILDEIPIVGPFLADFCYKTSLMCTENEEECKSYNEVRVLILDFKKIRLKY